MCVCVSVCLFGLGALEENIQKKLRVYFKHCSNFKKTEPAFLCFNAAKLQRPSPRRFPKRCSCFICYFFSPNFGCAACAIASALPLCRLCRRRCRWLYIRFALFLSGFVHHLSSLLLYLSSSRASSVPVLHSLRCFFSILPLFASFILYALCCQSCTLFAPCLATSSSRACVCIHVCVTCVCTCVRCLVQDACLT